MARPKTRSDEIYNERRRAKRLVQRLENQAFRSKTEKRQAQAYIDRLKNAISRTYANAKREYEESVSGVISTLSQVTRRGVGTAQERKNTIFASDINLASQRADSNISKSKDIAQAYTKIFYQTTRSSWEGLPKDKRNEAILLNLGMSDLREAFYYVLGTQKEAISRMHYNFGDVESTEDESFFYQPQDDREGSPDYLMLVRDITMLA